MENKKEEDKTYTFCSHCGAICTGVIVGRFIACKYCHLMSPIGASSFYKVKGGDNEMVEKKKAVKKASKKLSSKVEGQTVEEVVSGEKSSKQVLLEKVQQVKEFMDKTFPNASQEELKEINHLYWKLHIK